jgi:hypothetical protein
MDLSFFYSIFSFPEAASMLPDNCEAPKNALLKTLRIKSGCFLASSLGAIAKILTISFHRE